MAAASPAQPYPAYIPAYVRPRAAGVIDGVRWYVEQHSDAECLVITLTSGKPDPVLWQGPAPTGLTRDTAEAHCAVLIAQWRVKPMVSVPVPGRVA